MPDRHALLTRLICRLRTEDQREQFGRLGDFLSRALVPEDLQQVKKSRFSFEAAELVAPENIPAEAGEIINRLARAEAEANYRFAVREVPLRSTQIYGSNPLWARAELRWRQLSAPLLVWMGGGSGLIFSASKSWWPCMCKGSRNQRCSSNCGPVFVSSASISRSRPTPRPVITSMPAASG